MEINLYELNNILSYRGVFRDSDGSYYFYYSRDYEDAELDDHLWDVYCEVKNQLREMYPNIKFEDGWQDNNSCGFDIKFNL